MIPEPKKRKVNSRLMNVLLISLLLHLAVGFLAGSYIVVKYVIPSEAQFEEPPVVEEVEPPRDVKVEIKPQPAPENQPLQNLRMKQVGNISVANVDVELPNMSESFTVSSGIGNFGGGSLMGGTSGSIGLGTSDVSVFGLKTRAERILFAIDAGREMVIDKKGGLNSYKVIKDEITDMVGNLSAGTLFNVMLYDRRNVKFFKPQLVPAGRDVHRELVKWIADVNSDANTVGLRGASAGTATALKDEPVHETLKHSWTRGNETALMTQVAMEQNVDAVFFITGYHRGFERVRRAATEKEKAEWEKTTSSRKYQEQLAEHQKEIPEMERRVRERMAEINKDRAAKGMPPRVLAQRHGVYSNAGELELEWKTKHPGWQPGYYIEQREVEKYFRDLVKVLYTDKGGKRPSINVILFLAGDEELKKDWESSLTNYVRFFSGKSRIIRGLDEIKSARSASDTKN